MFWGNENGSRLPSAHRAVAAYSQFKIYFHQIKLRKRQTLGEWEHCASWFWPKSRFLLRGVWECRSGIQLFQTAPRRLWTSNIFGLQGRRRIKSKASGKWIILFTTNMLISIITFCRLLWKCGCYKTQHVKCSQNLTYDLAMLLNY